MEHQANMPVAAKRALAEANLDISGIDGIAFTRGPGMGICLSVACNTAKTLAAVTGKPLVGVHHMQAHALTPLLTSWPDIPTFPFLSLLISGGHTLLLLANSVDSFRVLTTTRDESIGRTFDKVTRELGLGWAGPSLEKFCNQDIENKTPQDFTPFSNAMPGEMGFSYLGYYSQVERFVHRRGSVENVAPEEKVAVARAFQVAAVDHLESKLMLGIKQCFRDNIPINMSSSVVGLRVIRIYELGKPLTQMLSNPPVNGRLTLQYPPPSLCTDDAVMVAWASIERFLASDHDEFILSPSGA
ncbi:Gcp-like domain-containing protein [Armillaria nabsnona]|nr:Gcp-like domain-containing protein [Armillaria nabsnona]